MALERGTFAFGGVTYPLAAATGNSLLRDADPAVYYTLDYFASVLQTHLGDRWDEAATAAGLPNIASAIVQGSCGFNPEDYLTEGQFALPLLAVYRDAALFGDHTNMYGWGIGTWRCEFILPPLTLSQAEQLLPILPSVVAVLVQRIQEGGDDGYDNGARVWELAGIDQIAAKAVRFGKYAGAQGLVLPTVQIELEVYEQQSTPDGAFDEVTSTGTSVDVYDPATETTVADFLQFEEPEEP